MFTGTLPNGRQQLHDSYIHGYPATQTMGSIQPGRIQVKLLKSDFALARTWWSVSFPGSQLKVLGRPHINLRMFNYGWKIVVAHTSTAKCDA
jgi:hypothetical protein